MNLEFVRCKECGLECEVSELTQNFGGILARSADWLSCPECNGEEFIDIQKIRKDGFKSECCNAPVNTFSNGNDYCNKCGEPCFVVKK